MESKEKELHLEESTETLVQNIFPHWNNAAEERKVVKMVAPMVRYSKLPFRMVCRKWGADLCFTPMIIAESFNRVQKARDQEFKTHSMDRPLIVQFATHDPIELAAAAFKVRDYAHGVDINCGCPQKWANEDKIGAWLSGQPEIVKDMVRKTRELTNVPVSIKIRLRKKFSETVDLLRSVEAAGVSYVTVHGRTLEERHKAPVHWDEIKLLKEIAKVPIVANGDINTPMDITQAVEKTGVDGVMCARGILANPGLFSGYEVCPLECITDYLEMSLMLGGHFVTHQHHMSYMMRGVSKADRKTFNQLRSMAGIIDFWKERGWWDRSLNINDSVLGKWDSSWNKWAQAPKPRLQLFEETFMKRISKGSDGRS